MANQKVQVRKATKQVATRRKGTHISTLRVAAYVRVSTDDEDQLESYQSQLKYYTEMINENPEWQMVGIYSDEAISGTKTDKRDDFNRMINDCMNGEIDMIIVKSISRFARNTVDTLQYVRALKERQIAVLFEEEGINTLSMDGELLLTILSSVAQQEVQNISEHVKLGLAMKMQRGEMIGFNGCLGFDYHKEDKTITVNPKEAEVVRYIFNRYVEGAGAKVIARELKNMGYTNKKGLSNFSQSGIIRIIKNEKYVGDLLMGKTFTLDPISKRRLANMGEVDQYYIENHHEPIVSRELFEQAQKILNKRGVANIRNNVNGKREKYSRQYAFSCMLKCGFCGGTLTRRTWNSRKDFHKTIWQCVKATKGGKRECPYCKGVPESLLEEAFVRAYNVLCNCDTSFVDVFLNRVKKALQKDGNEKEIKVVEKEIFNLKERKSQLVDMHLDDSIDKETYQQKVSDINNKLGRLYERRETLQLIKEEQEDTSKRLLEFQKVLSNNEVLQAFDRHVFECIIDRVEVGVIKENGDLDPYKLKFIFKTGMEKDEVAMVQPFSFANEYSHTSDEYGTICLHGNDDTYRDGSKTGSKIRGNKCNTVPINMEIKYQSLAMAACVLQRRQEPLIWTRQKKN